MPDVMARIYDDAHLRSVYKAIVEGMSYSLPDIDKSEAELIAPVVDCTIPSILSGDATMGRFYFLLRQRSNPQNVSVLLFLTSNQYYSIPSREEVGNAAFGTMYFFQELHTQRVQFRVAISLGYPYLPLALREYVFRGVDAEGLLSMESILPVDSTEIPNLIKTARRVGFFRNSFTQQSNVNNYAWLPESTGREALSQYSWLNNPVLHDVWAWVHFVQLAIALNLTASLVLLCLAIYRNFLDGKLWIGDAFVPVFNTQLISATAVLIAWVTGGFWTLRELCLHDAAIYANSDEPHVELSLATSGLLTLYFGACGLIGRITSERIDPLLAFVCFTVGMFGRIRILGAVAPGVRDQVVAYFNEVLTRSVSPQLPGQDKISPMRVWSAHDVNDLSVSFIMYCLLPILSTLIVIIAYAFGRKFHRLFYPELLHIQHGTSGTATSENEKTQSLIAQKRTLTFFEIATGAQLENRFGLVADYETCRFIKGMKYASADGVYTTGFVIANGKFLLQTVDFWSILLMKILKRRVRNIYVYEVNGTTVQQTARLVYPHTISFADLLYINVSMLS